MTGVMQFIMNVFLPQICFSRVNRACSSWRVLVICGIVMLQSCERTVEEKPGWPATTHQTKPWTRWWWHGSALTHEGITAELEAYQKAGLGGLEITPIYGVFGEEDQFVNYLSPQWVDLLTYTLKEAERLDLGIDMATGTGWPFGGPWVGDSDASKDLHYNVYSVKGGTRLKEPIAFTQQPYLRAVGSQLYEVNDSFSAEKTEALGTRKEPLMMVDPKNLDISQLKQPMSANKNLQALAIDQVVFERSLPLQRIMAYGDKGQVLDLTAKVDKAGILDWTAGEGDWTLYAVFQGWHGKMVERAGPGGEGYAIDHFSSLALQHYLSRFDSAFGDADIHTLRAFFNDSYEVDDARGSADWTSTLFDEFRKRRGYSLEEHLPALFGRDEADVNRRVLCDYRETISEMLLHNFTEPWKKWARTRSKIIRNQAHGSPSNILDLYATVDIPEIEGVDALRIRMASSAGNVSGKKLVSSESATWLNEHFESNLSDIKMALDRFMLNGVNHIFYHGTAYSPPDEPWPGRLFYAAVHLNPRNSLWRDFGTLNQYVTRCQSFLQDSRPDNDVLLYYPIYDPFSTPGQEMIEHFDGIGKQFEHSAFERAADLMLRDGFAFDYISDLQISNSRVAGRDLVTESGAEYKTIVIPHCRYIPVGTLEKIVSMAEDGVTIILLEGLPETFSGYGHYEKNSDDFHNVLKKLERVEQAGDGISSIRVGKGIVYVGDDLGVLLEHASIRKETMVGSGIQYIRKKRGNRTIYLIANSGDKIFKGWLRLQAKGISVVLYNPMNGEYGKAIVKSGDSDMELYVQVNGKQTLIVETYDEEIDIASFPYISPNGEAIPVEGKWGVVFESGGPQLPSPATTDMLASWTELGGPEYKAFSGTASYSIRFARPAIETTTWLLDLGSVRESAEVMLNEKSLGTLIGPSFQLAFDDALMKDDNLLEVKVSNLMANRISDMDKKKIFWKKFYNVNFPARRAENRVNGLFDASQWEPRKSGLLGPVQLVPIDIGEDGAR